MQKKLIRSCALPLAVLASLSVGLGQRPNSGAGLNAQDREFVTKAAQGGIAEVKMGQIAADHSSTNAIRNFGKRMVGDHSRANKELSRIAKGYGISVPTEMSPEEQATCAKLQSMRSKEFDASYGSTMVHDHQEDIALFKKEAKDGTGRLKEFAAKTLPTLEMHLHMAERLPK